MVVISFFCSVVGCRCCSVVVLKRCVNREIDNLMPATKMTIDASHISHVACQKTLSSVCGRTATDPESLDIELADIDNSNAEMQYPSCGTEDGRRRGICRRLASRRVTDDELASSFGADSARRRTRIRSYRTPKMFGRKGRSIRLFPTVYEPSIYRHENQTAASDRKSSE